MNGMHKRIAAPAAAALAAIAITIAFAGCKPKADSAADKAAADAEVKTVFAVTTIPAARGELKDYLEFGGDVSAKTSVDALPDSAGKIAEVRVAVGDRVEKNQVLAYVDPSRPGMTYELSAVKAPISGTVTAVNVVVGSMVSQQLSVAKVSRIDALQVSMNVPERYVSKIQLGQKAYLRFDAWPAAVFPATVREISPVLDATSRSMSVKLEPASGDTRIKAGMFARVKLITDTKADIVKIPEAAVVTRLGEDCVYTVGTDESGKTVAKRQVVVPGIRVDDKIEILSGVNPGDEVVVRGQTLLEEGSLVNVVNRLEPLPESESAQ